MLAPTFHSAGRSTSGPSSIVLIAALSLAAAAVIGGRALPESSVITPAPAAVVEVLAALRPASPATVVLDRVDPALEEFAAGGATGVRMDEAGNFAVRASVLSALHTTVLLDLGDVALPIDVRGARIYGLPRGALDLTALEGARVLVRGICPSGATPRGARCLSDTMMITFGGSAGSRGLVVSDAGLRGT